MQRYLIVIEPAPTGFSAYSPDLALCVAHEHAPSSISIFVGSRVLPTASSGVQTEA